MTCSPRGLGAQLVKDRHCRRRPRQAGIVAAQRLNAGLAASMPLADAATYDLRYTVFERASSCSALLHRSTRALTARPMMTNSIDTGAESESAAAAVWPVC